MINTYSKTKQTWIDLNSPTKEEIDSLVLSQNIDPIIAKDLLSPTPKQCAKVFGDTIYTVIHIPFFKHAHDLSLEQEIDFAIRDNTLITARYDSIDALHQFSKEIEVSEILHKKTNTHLFFEVMRRIYKTLFDEIDYMRDWTKEIEKNIFDGREKEMVFAISSASRNLLNFKRIVGPHKSVWSNLMIIGNKTLGDKFEKEIQLLTEEWEQLNTEIKNLSEMIDELRDTNNSIVSTKQNEIMKIFTILAFVTFPLSLIAGIFGMNSSHMPIIGYSGDFWIIIGIMTMVSVAMFGYFKYKRWI